MYKSIKIAIIFKKSRNNSSKKAKERMAEIKTDIKVSI